MPCKQGPFQAEMLRSGGRNIGQNNGIPNETGVRDRLLNNTIDESFHGANRNHLVKIS